MNNGIKVAAGALAFILVAGLLGNEDMKEAKAQRERYCNMVSLYQETNGESGWPAYDGEC